MSPAPAARAEPSSRPGSPQQQALWSQILDSVSSSRAIPSKNVLVLGEPQTGKSTVANALLQGNNGKANSRGREREQSTASDFALGYEWADVRDDADEDTIARLSVYTVPSSSASHLALVPYFLPPKSALSNTVVMIVLDWTKPWTFLEQLYKWLSWVDKWTRADGARELEFLREECRERLQSHLQHYVEPDLREAPSEPLPASSSTLNATVLPLGQGSLTQNPAGIPIVVVCTKADLIDEDNVSAGLVKGKGGEWEEKTDGIMQVLRTVCLQYGAALLYTTPQPTTQSILRLYTLHLLFAPPAQSTLGPDAAPIRNPFPFPHKSNTLDRDRILVPAGWDSWGKIAVIREGFEPKHWAESWEKDLEDGQGSPGGAFQMFVALVGGDDSDRPAPLPQMITTEPEQIFLAKHHDALSKARDPRDILTRQPQGPEPGGVTSYGTGVVGPMQSSTFSGYHVDKVIRELEGEDVASKIAKMTGGTAAAAAAPPRREPSRTASANAPSALNQSANMSSPAPAPRIATPSSPPAAGATSGQPQPSHEVLHNFFQSLLTARGAANTAAAPPNAAANPPAADQGQ